MRFHVRNPFYEPFAVNSWLLVGWMGLSCYFWFFLIVVFIDYDNVILIIKKEGEKSESFCCELSTYEDIIHSPDSLVLNSFSFD